MALLARFAGRVARTQEDGTSAPVTYARIGQRIVENQDELILTQQRTEAPLSNYSSASSLRRRKRDEPPRVLLGDEANERHIKAPQDQLFFSRKARPVNFEPYTLEQYRLQKPEKYFELGKLQPDLHRQDLVAKRKNLDRIKEFSNNLRAFNKGQKPKPPSPTRSKPPSKRDKALAFAKHIPKPKVVPSVPEPVSIIDNACQQQQPVSHLEELEAKHNHMRALASDIRRQYNFS